MKQIIYILTISLIVTSLMGCGFWKTKVIPKAKKEAVKKITAAIVKVGECHGEDEVKTDVEKLLKIESDEGMIIKAVGSESSPEGAEEEGVVSEICKAAAKIALPVLLSNGVPKDWDCELNELNSKIGELAEKACGKF